MIGIDLTGKNAFVTGVGDDKGLAWLISKTLQAAGATIWLASNPRTVNIVQMLLRRTGSQEGRKLPYGVEGEFSPAAVFGCDVEYDTLADIPPDVQKTRQYADGDMSIQGAFNKYRELSNNAPIDILIHAVAYTPEPQTPHPAVSRKAYLQAQSISAYSLVSLVREAMPLMEGRNASVVGLSYVASERVVADYGGGMASAKASLECDARTLAYFAGKHGHRVNIISAGPFASRAARSIGDIQEVTHRTAVRSALPRAITGQEVADTTLFLCSPLGTGVTAEIVHVDCGFHAMLTP